MDGISPATILQNRQSAINPTLAWRAVHETQTGGDELVAAFARWAADQRVAAAAAVRVAGAVAAEQAGASATWAGVLVDLAEQGATVVGDLARRPPDRSHRGGGPQTSACSKPGGGRPALVALSAIAR